MFEKPTEPLAPLLSEWPEGSGEPARAAGKELAWPAGVFEEGRRARGFGGARAIERRLLRPGGGGPRPLHGAVPGGGGGSFHDRFAAGGTRGWAALDDERDDCGGVPAGATSAALSVAVSIDAGAHAAPQLW